MSKVHIITLASGMRVRVREDDWPVIVSAFGDSFKGDHEKRSQAKQQGEVDQYMIEVRQHVDGRAIIYGVLDAAIAAWQQPADGESCKSGYLLGPGENIAAAIRWVGKDCNLPDVVISECIADLPPVDM